MQLRGRVTKFFPESDYGFIRTADGRDLYFHAKSVIGEGVEPGATVEFTEEEGDQGPSATSVRVVGDRLLRASER